nr:N-acetyltransferase [Nocardia transvalensis]
MIRRERPGDIPSIDAVHRAAFAREYPNGSPEGAPRALADPAEVTLVHRLRSDSGWMPTLSLVAQIHDRVIGHVCLTRAGVGPFPALALGPIGVLADRQDAGVGSALMHAALGAADALDEPLIGLLGSLDYYPRFGFLPGARVGIVPDQPDWTSHFQVRLLTAYGPEMTGEFHYAEPFYTL